MGKKLLIHNEHVANIHTLEVYKQHGGYASVEKAIKTMTPEAIVEEVKKSGLRGRGGAGFPTGMKWSFLAKPEGVARYLVCNADESEPGTFKDRYLMEKIPHALVEGMITSSYALGANRSYIYIRGEYMWVYKILERAIAEAKAAGWLGKNILGTGYDLELYVHCGAGAYICGEETALIESLEGKRGNPRIKPPFPAIQGLWQRPTVVNNVESLAYAARVIELGEDFFLSMGTPETPGTKLISISGDVAKPGIYEIEYGTSIRELLGIEMSQATAPYFVQVSGPSGEPVGPSEFDRKICMEDILCGGSFMVFNRTRDILHILRNFMEFFKEESCGVCTPCRAGNFILNEKVKKQ